MSFRTQKSRKNAPFSLKLRKNKQLSTAEKTRVGVWSTVFLGAGVLHFVKPEFFDSIVPEQLPGTQRDWTLGSGVMEVGLGASILGAAMIPSMRPALSSVVGPASAIFLAGVWPGNIKMMIDYLNSNNPKIDAKAKAIAVARVPLQLPMIWSTLKL